MGDDLLGVDWKTSELSCNFLRLECIGLGRILSAIFLTPTSSSELSAVSVSSYCPVKMSSSEDSKKLVKLLLGLIFLLIELVEMVDALRFERLKFDVDDVTRDGGPTAGEKTESSAEHLSLEDSRKVASAFSVKDVVEPTGRVLTDNND